MAHLHKIYMPISNTILKLHDHIHIHDDDTLGWYAAPRGTPAPANLNEFTMQPKAMPKVNQTIQQTWQLPPY